MKSGQKNNSNIDTQADKSVRLTIVDVMTRIERIIDARNPNLNHSKVGTKFDVKLGQKNNSNIDTQADKSVRLTIVDVMTRIERIIDARNPNLNHSKVGTKFDVKLGQKNNSNIDTQADKSVRLTIVDVMTRIERIIDARKPNLNHSKVGTKFIVKLGQKK